jgi:prepilin-type N-terminal cleavage/methylation domain-containing protein
VNRVPDQSGFSLVEVLVAAVILVLGATAAFSLIDSANRSISANSARSGGTNLARELTEYARATDYDLLQDDQVVAALRARPTVQGTLSGGTWTIERRNVAYTVTASACTFDDPKDGLATTPPDEACPAAAAVNAVNDLNGDDFRRVTVTLTWKVRERPGKSVQTAVIVNPAGGLGPRITSFHEPGAEITGESQTWGGVSTLRLTSTPASSVSWTTDDGKSNGDASGGPNEWGFTWDFGTAFDTSGPWVRDGSYQVQAQAKDDRGIPGEARIITIHVNRHAPGQVPGFIGGWNKTHQVVDLRWSRYDERDLQGYVVKRNGVQVCPTAGDPQQALSCSTPLSDPIGATYDLYALDCQDLKQRINCTRPSPTPSSVTVLKAPGDDTPAPSAPTGLTATVVDGLPQLSWTAPSSVSAGPIRFYRIYRDSGTQLGDRYDETITGATDYTDPNPGGTTAHKYWVTAVDQNFTESDPSAPVLSPPVS